MKISHIIGIIVIAIAIGVIASTAGDASVYTTFTKAEKMAQDGDEKMIHVVGKLKKDPHGQIVDMFYNPAIDPNHFEFTLVDNDQRAQKVIYNSPKPQDFDRSEQVVVIGAMQGDHFQCKKILLKCPSKYQNNKLETTEHEAKTAQL
ncbi:MULTISPECIES: cytochrome c maturation protein CcmE [unclassified Spirosoma]|uniref:cytochrome c maturation protein CcmE domain-containing protein n=1 Tax=unclassified Spirosoma TaxID=2621999 RepID=UPI000959A48B|nr:MULTISPECIES: cytochrome c maturation protein CcmE [unclassified Spirosoma]MBN8825229.1 cytochrome c maturation protein CcmE [Spirosoma sp.]OJW75283.1 MAG: cytochrome C biogenesis protein [Spirosoma sp. 48-14]